MEIPECAFASECNLEHSGEAFAPIQWRNGLESEYMSTASVVNSTGSPFQKT